MRVIEQLAQEKYNGDIKKALEYIFKYAPEDIILSATETMNKEEWEYFVTMQEVWAKELQQEKGSNNSFTISSEDLNKTTTNKAKSKMKLDILKLFIVNGGILGLGALISNTGIKGIDFESISKMAAFVYTGILANDFGVNLMEYLEYKKNEKENKRSGMKL